MAGILNRTARQFNLKTMKDGHRAVIRLAPGFNVVPDEHWKYFVEGKNIDPYVSQLKKQNLIDFGPKVDDMELDTEPSTKIKSKVESMEKLKAAAKQAAKEAETAKMENEKLAEELKEAKAKAEKAELELENLKKASGSKEKQEDPKAK